MGRQKRGGGTPTLVPTSFDAAEPAAFYLLDSREGLEALSDATLVVEDVELPVHSQVLSLQSKVLLDMFTAVADADESTSSSKEKAVLKEAFAGCDLFEVALFLRFAYRPTDLTPVNLATVRGSLLGLLRLAHKLDAPQIMQAVAQQFGECAGTAATQAELLSWAEAAEQCCLPELRMRCLREVAHRLASGSDSLAATFSSTARLADSCDHSTLATLLGLLAAGCGSTGALRMLAATPAAAVEALEASANHGSFEWAVDRFSQLPSGVGESTFSPFFKVAGIDWRFRIYPGGDREESADHFSAYIVPKQGNFIAKYAITVVDQGPTKQDLHSRADDARVFEEGAGWGWRKFATTAKLRSQPNSYLRGDRLLLQATVEVIERNVPRL